MITYYISINVFDLKCCNNFENYYKGADFVVMVPAARRDGLHYTQQLARARVVVLNIHKRALVRGVDICRFTARRARNCKGPSAVNCKGRRYISTIDTFSVQNMKS